jgi:hypothetical protein
LSFSRVDSCVERKGREARGSDRAGTDGRSGKRKRREKKKKWRHTGVVEKNSGSVSPALMR